MLFQDPDSPIRLAHTKKLPPSGKIKKGTKTPHRKPLILSSKKQSIYRVIRAAAINARRQKEGGISMYILSSYLPLIMKNKDPEKDPVSTQLPEWRNLHNSFKAVMYQLALADTENKEKNGSHKKLVPFVFCLTQKLTNEAATHKNEAAYISSRLTGSLRHKLKEVPPYWLSLEMAARNEQGFPHVQGSILLTDDQIPEFKAAIRSLNGKATPKFKNYETRTRESRRQDLINSRGQLHTDMNWALYNTKESGRVGQFTKCKRNIAVRQDLTNVAKQLYQELKELHPQRLPITKTLNNNLWLTKNNTYHLNQPVKEISHRLFTTNYLANEAIKGKAMPSINQKRHRNQMKTQQITLSYLSDILEQSTIVETISTGGLLSHTINHPALGNCQTVQADSSYLLFTCL